MNPQAEQHPERGASATLIGEITEAVARLEALASEERTAMIAQDLTRMATLLESKQALLVRVAELCDRPDFRSHLDSEPELVARLKEVAGRFRERNAANQAIAGVQISHARQSLMMLRAVLGLRDTTLYGNRGEVTVSKEQRHLGSA